MPRYAYVNGAYVRHDAAHVHIEDRGFQFADGVYEVVACINGTMADEAGHLDRLERSLSELKIAMPLPRRTLQMVMRELIRRNKLRSANVYIQVTRGQAKRDFVFPKDARPSLVVTARPFNFESANKSEKGVAAFTVPDIRWKRRDIKSVALLPQVLARQESAEKGGAEAILVDDDGLVTEGAASNAWIVTRDGDIVTRQVSHKILRGVTRTALQKIASDLQLKIVERAFTPQEAYDAAEVFCTGAVALVVPVVTLDGKTIGTGKPGPVAKRLYDEYRAYVGGAHGDHVRWNAGLN